MTPLQRYIAEEIAADHADGLLPRREALRRLGLLGLGATAAAALLAACANSDTPITDSTPTSPSTPPGSAAALPTSAVTFAGPRGTLQAAWAAAPQPRGGVLVIHENKGLTDHIRSVAGRFAGAGYSALAVDLLSARGGTATFTDPAEATAELSRIPQDQLVADLRAGLDELGRRVEGKKLGTTGFCFGGGLTWLLLASGPSPLAAATPFYGPFPDNGDLSASKAAVLGVYAAADARVNASRPAAEAALARSGNPHQIFTAPDADHAFFNDTGQRYNATAATEAWRRVLDWYGMYLG
ncbi:dienelactone hydrolase family protein [Nocardia sp. CDC186]|uniref:Dienelactone hydrolase family protein n=1 Tax=Nocardia implantans TaxID=3108168 RepID=A0ABU6AZR8_9NOCA|nr:MULTISPECIES: dienelactone hydrolase family protein [unclassified Nocardia]MBF6194265.1 dienelactone hydrolase family protein [Nocardia beijingensis]MEA3529873.1 dienelactone hydrolase family protein [Nocardia sp. CDC192]MEB3512649.1 dienelactone hydrolase family protein [Nocardia sp. CDC186]